MSLNYNSAKNGTAQNIFTNTMTDMKWTDIKRHVGENAIVLLPIAVIEQHGPHLCLAADIYTAHILCLSVKQILTEKGYASIIAPPFYWGINQAGRGFPGSFNIRAETMQALLFDILASLKEFGFTRVFGVNWHNDIEHRIVAMYAFKDACEQLKITACFPHDNYWMPDTLGIHSSDPCCYTVEPPVKQYSKAPVWDVHGGDMETAVIHASYPHLVDTEKAESLPDVPLPDGKFEAWMFGGALSQLSPQGYLGSPSSYASFDVPGFIEDNARRIVDAIIARLNQNEGNERK